MFSIAAKLFFKLCEVQSKTFEVIFIWEEPERAAFVIQRHLASVYRFDTASMLLPIIPRCSNEQMVEKVNCSTKTKTRL